MNRILRIAVIALMLAACGGSKNSTTEGLNANEPSVGQQDVQPEAVGCDESSITAVHTDDNLIVTLPVTVSQQGGSSNATIRVSITTLGGNEVGTATVETTLDSGANDVDVVLPSSVIPENADQEVAHLIHYEIKMGSVTASGYKSLFYALGKVDLRARVPSNLIVEEGSQMRVFALNPFDQTPMADFDVRVVLTPISSDAEGTGDATPIEIDAKTGDDGSAVVDIPGQDEGSYTVQTQATMGAYVAAFIDDNLQVERSHRVLVTTDKPIYQPGQMMHIRALALSRPSLKAEADRDITFEVYDGKGNMVFRRFELTNDFGIAGTDFQIASQVNMGAYRVKAIIGNSATEKTVDVKHYVLPKFKVETSLSGEYYLVGETLSGYANIHYFFGKAVDGGSVEMSATIPELGIYQYKSVSGKTNEDGLFTFEFDLEDPFDMAGWQGEQMERAILNLDIKAVDTAGQTVETTVSTILAKKPIHLMAIAEGGNVVPGIENRIYVFSTDPLNRPIDTDLTVTVEDEEVEVTAVGDGVGYFDYQPAAIEIEVDDREDEWGDDVGFGVPDAPAMDMEAGEGVSNDSGGWGSSFGCTISASTSDGDSATKTFYFYPGQSQGGFLIRTDQSLYEAGDTVILKAFASGTMSTVFFDLVKDNQTMLTTHTGVVDGVAELQLDLDPSLVGDVFIDGYAIRSDGTMLRETRAIFVRDADALDITVTPEQETYKPGEEATIDFHVTDADGAPVTAALGVQIVDEAVYAVSDNKPGLLETYFQASESLQEPGEDDEMPIDVPTLLNADGEDESAQASAGASFAALAQSGLFGEQSSWSLLKGLVTSNVDNALMVHLDEIGIILHQLADEGTLTEENFEESLASQTVFFDYWGNAYQLEAVDRWDGLYAHVTSLGPDESKDSWDDWQGEVGIILHDEVEMNMAAEAAGGWGDEEGFADEAPMMDGDDSASGPNKLGSEDGEGPKVRKDFPETLYFNPALIAEEGVASITLNMADSITEWRVSTLANTADGALGSTTGSVIVFQDFFIDVDFPVSLTQNDEVSFPVAIYNYLPVPQEVTISLEDAEWYTLTEGESEETIEVNPGEVTSITFPVKVNEVGWHALTVTGMGSEMSDAVQRVVQVLPDGVEHISTGSGMLEGTVSETMPLPEDYIVHSEELWLKIYPGIMAQMVEGLDSLLQQPSGCFEQTTATNWPNTLVMDYLNSTNQASPEIEEKALGYLEQGYQRLLTFECTGGGFVWFGDPSPANVVLSAMGVMEFSDMAKVIEIDPDVIERTANWVINAQQNDGSWTTNQGSEFATVQYDDVKTTAWTAWALAQSEYGASAVSSALSWLTPYATASDTDIYSLAMMANAFATAAPDDATTTALLDRLSGEVTSIDDLKYWEYDGTSYGYGGGMANGVNATSIEVTALTVMAFLTAEAQLDLVPGAIAFMASNKDGMGNWGTTHATILSLRAMVMSLQNKTEEGEGTVSVDVNGKTEETLEITDVNRNVFHQMELTSYIARAAQGETTTEISVTYEGTGSLMYQVTSTHWTPHSEETGDDDSPFTLEVSFEETTLAVGDVTTVTATVTNTSDVDQNMPMLSIGLPPGVAVQPDKLDAAVAEQRIMKYELSGQAIVVYIDTLESGESLTVQADIQAGLAINAQSRPSSSYLYYAPEVSTDAPSVGFVVQ